MLALPAWSQTITKKDQDQAAVFTRCERAQVMLLDDQVSPVDEIAVAVAWSCLYVLPMPATCGAVCRENFVDASAGLLSPWILEWRALNRKMN
jgi:hypothetical protein